MDATIVGKSASVYGSLDASDRKELVDGVVGLRFLVNIVKTVQKGFTNFTFAKKMQHALSFRMLSSIPSNQPYANEHDYILEIQGHRP